MEEWNMDTTSKADEEGQEQVEGIQDCVMEEESSNGGGIIAELLPVSPLKCRGVATELQAKVEEKLSTASVPNSPKSTVANTASADVESAESSIDYDSVLTVVLEEESSGSNSMPNPQKSSVAKTARADVSQDENTNSDLTPTVVIEEESSGSDSVPTLQKSSESGFSSSHVVKQANEDALMNEELEGKQCATIDSDSDQTLVLEEESSGSNSTPTSQKSPEPKTPSADASQEGNTDSDLPLSVLLEKEASGRDSMPSLQLSSESGSASCDVQEVNKDTPLVVDEENEDILAMVKKRNDKLILNDKILLTQTLIVELLSLLIARKMTCVLSKEKEGTEVNPTQNKSNSRKRPNSAIAEASCGTSASGSMTGGPPPVTTGCTNIMDYYIAMRKGDNCDYSRLLSENPCLLNELNNYTEKMKSLIMLPVKHPKEPESTEESNPSILTTPTGKRARKEDKTNGAQKSEITELAKNQDIITID